MFGPNIQYFGYYGSGPTIAQVAGQSNVVFLGAPNRIKVASAAELKTILTLSGIFTPAIELDPNYLSNWQTNYVSVLQPQELSNIAAIYLADEPYWNAYLNCQSSPSTCQTAAQVYASLETAIAMIHGTVGFANIPIAINFAAPSVNASLQIPPDANWLGFDCYGSITNCSGNSIRGYINILKSKLSAGQRLFAVPEGFILSAQTPTSADTAALATRIQEYMGIVASEPPFIAILPFRWADMAGPNGQTYYGTGSLSTIQALYASYAQGVPGQPSSLFAAYPSPLDGGSSTLSVLNGANGLQDITAAVSLPFGPYPVNQAQILFGNYTNGERPDLFLMLYSGVTASSQLEVHIYSSGSNYQQVVLSAVTPLPLGVAGQMQFALGSYLGGQNPDLYVVDTSIMNLKVLSGDSNYATKVADEALSWAPQAPGTSQVLLGNFKNGQLPDLYLLRFSGTTASNQVELDILNGNTNYTTSVNPIALPLPLSAPGGQSFGLGKFTSDPVADLYQMSASGTSATATMMVQVLTGTSRYHQSAMMTTLPLAGDGTAQFGLGGD